jgi:hypothetical protein
MNYIHHNFRLCHAILTRTSPKRFDWQADFAEGIYLEDGRRYRVGITIRYDPDGEQELSLYLKLLHLTKTPIWTGPEVVQ